MSQQPQEIVTRQLWLEARQELLAREKELTRLKDELASARRALPLVHVETDYRFQSENGEQSLADLFGPHRQLIIYHFMFGADWEQGCPSCSFWADNFNGLEPHLAARNTAFCCISNAPPPKISAYKARLGWTFPWLSASGTSFGRDFGVTFPKEKVPDLSYNYNRQPFGEEMPGLSVFLRLDDNRIAHSYSTYGRGLESFNAAYHLLDLTPLGRDEDELSNKMAWVKRRDQYSGDVM